MADDDPSKTTRLDKLSLNTAPPTAKGGLLASQHSPANSSKPAAPKTPSNHPTSTPSTTQQQTQSQSRDTTVAADDDDDARTAALQSELATLQHMNSAITGISASLASARTNMATISATVTHATTLLDTWTRILAQAEHNQQLLLHPAWAGASQDLADAENEDLQRAREKERRDAEDAARRAAAEERRRAEEERRRVEAEKAEAKAAAARPAPRRGVAASRGRSVGGIGRGASATTSTGTEEKKPATGRAAVAGYGRVGSIGTKAARGRGTKPS